MTDGVCKACENVVSLRVPVCTHHTIEPWVVVHVEVFSTGQPALLLGDNASSNMEYNGHGTTPNLSCMLTA